MKVFIDLDGVLANFVQAACDVHGIPNPYHNPENFGNFNMAQVTGMSNNQFWKPLQGHSFWTNLPLHDDAHAILANVEARFRQEDIAFLTANSRDPFSASGKLSWVQKHFPKYVRRVIITPAKHFIAHSETLLIDDRDKNCEDFYSEGGRCILLPRPWNSAHAEHTLSTITQHLNWY